MDPSEVLRKMEQAAQGEPAWLTEPVRQAVDEKVADMAVTARAANPLPMEQRLANWEAKKAENSTATQSMVEERKDGFLETLAMLCKAEEEAETTKKAKKYKKRKAPSSSTSSAPPISTSKN